MLSLVRIDSDIPNGIKYFVIAEESVLAVAREYISPVTGRRMRSGVPSVRNIVVVHRPDGWACQACQPPPYHPVLAPPCEHIRFAIELYLTNGYATTEREEYLQECARQSREAEARGARRIENASDVELEDRANHPDWFIPRNSITGEEIDRVRAEAYTEMNHRRARRQHERLTHDRAIAERRARNAQIDRERARFSWQWFDNLLPESEQVKVRCCNAPNTDGSYRCNKELGHSGDHVHSFIRNGERDFYWWPVKPAPEPIATLDLHAKRRIRVEE
jgi:hypothetical protein